MSACQCTTCLARANSSAHAARLSLVEATRIRACITMGVYEGAVDDGRSDFDEVAMVDLLHAAIDRVTAPPADEEVQAPIGAAMGHHAAAFAATVAGLLGESTSCAPPATAALLPTPAPPPPRPCAQRHPDGDRWCYLPDGHEGPHDAPAPRALPTSDHGPHGTRRTAPR